MTRESEGLSDAVSMILTDPDELDCPVCYYPLWSPIYQSIYQVLSHPYLTPAQSNRICNAFAHLLVLSLF
ncbi:hypothetical protein ACS0TY_003464 [Phlomoides rotata]